MREVAVRRYVAFFLWFLFLLLSFACASWQMHMIHQHAESVLGSRAAYVAEQLARLLEVPDWTFDLPAARRIVFTTMRDPELYAVKVLRGDALLEGQRRGADGELEPWDGELIEKTVQAIWPVEREGKKVGTVEVYLRVGPTVALVSSSSLQEMVRFVLFFLFSALCLFLYLRASGDLSHLPSVLSAFKDRIASLLRTHRERKVPEKRACVGSGLDAFAPVDLEAGRLFQHTDVRASFVTAGLFSHVFAGAPAVMSRLLAENRSEELQRLGRLLELSAPCIGAFGLQKAASGMRGALSSSSDLYYTEVEACIVALEHVLAALKAQN